ncbi:MAG: 2OG-Fe(II) oxygenase [Arenicella sp.]|nr:2OG-Fe(II) oxygenase [Arenicella sp.]
MTVTEIELVLDKKNISDQLDAHGFALTKPLLSSSQCRQLAALYEDPTVSFRSRVDMTRYNFGRGEYKYFDYPLPSFVESLRKLLYPSLAAIANEWNMRWGMPATWPNSHAKLLAACHEHGQMRPTPLLLKYGVGDYNCLHQDLYGDIHFPLQVILQLSVPGVDFEGGDLVLVEQRPRMQSRPSVISPKQGQAIIVPVKDRPYNGKKGWSRTQIRHGVSTVSRGTRQTLGVIFHDAT